MVLITAKIVASVNTIPLMRLRIAMIIMGVMYIDQSNTHIAIKIWGGDRAEFYDYFASCTERTH